MRASILSRKVMVCSRTADTCAATTATSRKARTEWVWRSTQNSSRFTGAMRGRYSDPNNDERATGGRNHRPADQRLSQQECVERHLGRHDEDVFEPSHCRGQRRGPVGEPVDDSNDHHRKDDHPERFVDDEQRCVVGDGAHHGEPDEQHREHQDRGQPVQDSAQRGESLRFRCRRGVVVHRGAHSATAPTLTAGALLGSPARSRNDAA